MVYNSGCIVEDKCIICNIPLEFKGIYLCEIHTQELTNISHNKGKFQSIILYNPSFNEHCMLCGEWEDRIIINHPDWNYICDKCLFEAQTKY